MKAALQIPAKPAPAKVPPRGEASWRKVLRLALAAALLVAVYLLAGALPTASGPDSLDTMGRVLVFWVLGGVFTIFVLILSDRRA